MFGKLFKITLFSLLVAEIISFVGYYIPLINYIGFFIIAITALFLSFYKLEYGLYILFAELFVGSKGYLFYFDDISIRIALFIVVFGVWLGRFLIKSVGVSLVGTQNAKQIQGHTQGAPLQNYWLILIFFVLWGIIRGFLSGNEFSSIFLDANAWFFLLLIFPVCDVIKNDSQIKNIFQILFAAIALLSIKTLVSLFIFTHFNWEITGWVFDFYRWIRETGVGEVTSAGKGFYRVFFQSQIWVLVGLLILLCLFFRRDAKYRRDAIYCVSTVVFTGLLFATILTSFSRSFWVGGAAGLVMIIGLLIYLKVEVKKVLVFLSKTILAGAVGFLIVFLIVNSFVGIIGERATEFEGAAVSSRWNLLPPLWEKVKDNWILGSGFGTTVTYQTQDPRILQSNPDGWYTTYAFEWGYLDIWLKLGIGGLLAYLVLIGKIFHRGLQSETGARMLCGLQSLTGARMRDDKKAPVGRLEPANERLEPAMLDIGLLAGLVALCVTHIFSPYLNHPLGIGYIILLSVIFEIQKNSKKY